MPRKSRSDRPEGSSGTFRFVWVDWNTKQLTELRGWLEGNTLAVVDAIQHLSDESWKISISENKRTGRYLVSITDKGGRQGCTSVSFGIEHSDLTSAILGAVYYATEIIGTGLAEGDHGSMDDLW